MNDLQQKELAEESDGAVCVFPEGFANKEGDPLPLIIQMQVITGAVEPQDAIYQSGKPCAKVSVFAQSTRVGNRTLTKVLG